MKFSSLSGSKPTKVTKLTDCTRCNCQCRDRQSPIAVLRGECRIYRCNTGTRCQYESGMWEGLNVRCPVSHSEIVTCKTLIVVTPP